MKYLTKGIAFASVFALPLSAAMGSMGSSMSKSPLRFYLSLGGVYKKKDVKVTSEVIAEYNTSFYAVGDNANVFANGWDQNGATPANANDVMALAGLNHGPIAAVVNDAARINIARTLQLPTNILAQPNGGGGAVITASSTIQNALVRVITVPLAGGNLNQAGVLKDDRYSVSATHTSNLDIGNFGVRLDGGIGYAILDELVIYASGGYCFEIGGDKDKSSSTLNLELKDNDKETEIKAADGTTKITKKGLTNKPFAWNKNKVTKDLKASATVKETVNIVGGLRWMPADMIELYAFAGVKRYEVEVSYDGGYLAYPGRPELYVEDFRKKDDVHKLLVKNEKTYTLKETAWPFTFGGGLNIVFCDMHHLGFAVEYASFDMELAGGEAKSSDSDKKDDDKKDSSSDSSEKYIETETIGNPIGDVTLANMAPNIQSWHMSDAKDVKYKIKSKVDVGDLTFKLAYTISL